MVFLDLTAKEIPQYNSTSACGI